MKHQYESEILFHLMERDGFNIPSSVPPYEAEIKAYLINQVKLAYPKLTDYEAEWLLYNYTKHLPADFPISSATNVTKATFENVVPFAYQSAILKGNTLVNIFTRATKGFHYNATNDGNKGFTMTGDGTDTCHSWWNLELSTTKQYILSFDVTVNTANQGVIIKGSDEQNIAFFPIGTKGKQTVIFTPTASGIRFKVEQNLTGTIIVDNIMIMDYQDGMENWDIPYFEGMKSVKMPVVKTVGKNLWNNYQLERGSINHLNGASLNQYTTQTRSKDYIPIVPNTKYIATSYSFDGTTASDLIRYYDSEKNFIGTSPNEKSTFLRTVFQMDIDNISHIQLEVGTVATSYEPYKTNILSTSEEVELRGIGEVQDTLDCLTGELTQRIGEVVLDGSEDEGWNVNGDRNSAISMVSNKIIASLNATGVICADFVTSNNGTANNIELIRLSTTSGKVIIHILKSKLGLTSDITDDKVLKNSFKAWLSQNPLTVQYELKTESVKTVDLKTVNESGESVYFMPLEGTMHVISSGEIIQPTFDMSVPVEATTQNLASFIDLEMEE